MQKNYLIYKYIFGPLPPKNIQLSIHVRINEFAHTTTTINALHQEPVIAQAAKALHFHSSPRAVVGSESQRAGQVLEVSK